MSILEKSPNYPAKVFAVLFNVTERRIQQLAKEKIIPKAGRGMYPLVGVIQAYTQYLQERSLRSELSNTDLQSEKLRLTKAQADNLELKNELARGRTVPTEIISEVLASVSEEASGILDTIPIDIKRKHPALEQGVISDVQLHVVKAQNAIARVDEVLVTALDDYISNSEAD